MVTLYCSLVLCEDIITSIYKVIIGWTQGLPDDDKSSVYYI